MPELINRLRSDRPPAVIKDAALTLSHRRDPLVRSLLIDALGSSDRLQAQRALGVLAWRREIDPPSKPDDARGARSPDPTERWTILRCAMDALRHDDLPNRELRMSPLHDDLEIFNAAWAVRWLSANAREGQHLLVRGLSSDDVQQRFLSAVALGFGRQTAHAQAACPVLIEHLHDNGIPWDSAWAACALARFGAAARSAIDAALLSVKTDAQARRTLLRLRDRLDGRAGAYDDLARTPRDLLMDWGESIVRASRPAMGEPSITPRPPGGIWPPSAPATDPR